MGLQKECREQTVTIETLRKERDDSRNEADDAHRGAIQRLQAEIHGANSAVEKMRACG